MATPTLRKRSPFSFETLNPGALATWLMATHGFLGLVPMANESYRLAADGMVACIFAGGLITCEGRHPGALALPLSDLCAEEDNAA